MLVLSRKQWERIRIGAGITITVLQIQGNRVRIGVVAPEDQKILRDELCDEPQPPATRSAAS